MVRCAWVVSVVLRTLAQESCQSCGRTIRKQKYHHLCPPCKTLQRHPPADQKEEAEQETSPRLLPPADAPLHAHIGTHRRHAIATMHELGQPDAAISTTLHVSRRAVKRWKESEEFKDAPRAGRPDVLEEEEQCMVAVRAADDPYVVPKMIKHEHHLDCSDDTIDRTLIKAGLYGRVATKTYPYGGDKRALRVGFGQAFRHWTKALWERVVFTDETTWTLGMQRHRVYVRRPRGKEAQHDPQYTWQDETRLQTGQLKCWFGFTAHGRATVGFYEKLDGPVLKKLLAEHLLPFVRRMFPSGPAAVQWYVIHDNDRRWKGDVVSKFFHDNGVSDLPFPWPPHSPDINPAENLISDWKERVWDRNPCGLDELRQFILEEWERTPPELLLQLAHSMIKRCRRLIERQGHKLAY